MKNTWRDIRSILAFQQALTGRWLPLPVQEGSLDASNRSSRPSSSQQVTNPHTPMTTQSLFDDSSDAENPYERIEAQIPEESPIREMDSLDELATYVEDTVLIPLDESRKNAVFGIGPKDADLMIIGEAPGAQEDEQGEPFVGRAGKLLDKILQAIDFGREDVYITNILKSRPPRNRNPRPAEVEAHMPILYKQFALIQPKLILCVGKVAGNTLLDRSSSLGSMRGTFHNFYGIPVMVTYHPAALLRNPQWKRPTWEDVKLLRSRYDELEK